MSSKKKMSLINNLIQIIKFSEEDGLTKQMFKKAENHINAVVEKLHITPVQVVLFAQFFKSYDERTSLSSVSNYLDLSSADMLKYMDDIDLLAKKKFILRNKRSHAVYYNIPNRIVDVIKNNEELISQKRNDLDIVDFFSVVEDVLEQKNEDDLEFVFFIDEIKALLKANQQLLFAKKVKKLSLNDANLALFIMCCLKYVNGNDSVDISDLKELYDKKDFNRIRRSLMSGENELLKKNYIVYSRKNTLFRIVEEFELTEKTKTEFLNELKIEQKVSIDRKKFINFDLISKKKMFYNEKEKEQIMQLVDLLLDENFSQVQEKLKQNGMRSGFNCIFSGFPGTGKTETVYQIARETRRDIMAVDISDTKSMWYGESEKIIKQIFEQYKKAVEYCERTPILLLNEADAVLGKRKDVTQSIDQTANAIQNIILQEMENLKGIMIATTNLTNNLDKAFERRFLYKIEFEKPAVDVRKELWKSMLPGLNNSDARKLAEKFEFSGGQMENIGRKKSVSTILNGKKLLLPDIIKLCEEENYTKQKSSRPIGFVL